MSQVIGKKKSLYTRSKAPVLEEEYRVATKLFLEQCLVSSFSAVLIGQVPHDLIADCRVSKRNLWL